MAYYNGIKRFNYDLSQPFSLMKFNSEAGFKREIGRRSSFDLDGPWCGGSKQPEARANIDNFGAQQCLIDYIVKGRQSWN